MAKKHHNKYKNIPHGHYPFAMGEIGKKLREYKEKLLNGRITS